MESIERETSSVSGMARGVTDSRMNHVARKNKSCYTMSGCVLLISLYARMNVCKYACMNSLGGRPACRLRTPRFSTVKAQVPQARHDFSQVA